MDNKPATGLRDLVIAIKGGGDLATGIALRLFRAGFSRIFIMETPSPTVLRRKVAFAAAIYENTVTVEGVEALRLETEDEIAPAWGRGRIPVLPDPEWKTMTAVPPHILVDAIVAKKNLGTRISDADLVMGLGPGFTAGKDVHFVIETRRGHDLGRLITQGTASANTSQPEAVMGITGDRLLRAPCSGIFTPNAAIGNRVAAGQVLGHVNKEPVISKISGVVRGLVHGGVKIGQNRKLGDVDPRGKKIYCHTVSDKARALGGAVLEAILGQYNR